MVTDVDDIFVGRADKDTVYCPCAIAYALGGKNLRAQSHASVGAYPVVGYACVVPSFLLAYEPSDATSQVR